MKKKKGSIGGAVLNAGVGVAGGVVANLVDANLLSSQDNTIKAAVKAGVGALLPMFIGGSVVEALSASMIGVAGYQLAGTIGIGEEVSLGGSASAESAAATAGLGITPSYRSASMAGNAWVKSHAQKKSQVAGTVDANLATTTM